MSIRGSRSPNFSAIEDRVISQSERAARIRTEAAAEALEYEKRLREAEVRTAAPNNSVARARSHGGNFAAEAERVERRRVHNHDVENQRTFRDPCVKCGVRADHHAQFGCKRWRGSE